MKRYLNLKPLLKIVNLVNNIFIQQMFQISFTIIYFTVYIIYYFDLYHLQMPILLYHLF